MELLSQRRQKRHSQRGRVGRADADEDLLEGVYRIRPEQVVQELRKMAGNAQHTDEVNRMKCGAMIVI